MPAAGRRAFRTILLYKRNCILRETAMTRLAFLFALAGMTLLGVADARADHRLVVGAAAGYYVPPGYRVVPVYTRPVGPAWTPVDTTMGRPFREPIYSTPRGYRYAYIRGYTLRRMVAYHAPRVKRVSVTKSRKTRRHRGRCITDIGFGRHEYCN
jgi:hypothetical protein